jgi:hypothetical protein
MKNHIHRFKRYSTKWHHYGVTSRVESRYRCIICGKKIIHDGVSGFFNEQGREIHPQYIVGRGYLPRKEKESFIQRLKKVV